MKKYELLIPGIFALLVFSGCNAVPCQKDGDGYEEHCSVDDDDNDSAMNGTSHNPGQYCGGCHGIGVKDFSIAGTIYTDAAGTAPASGKTIIIRDAGGNEITRLTSDSLGNFYSVAPLAYPFKVESLSAGFSMGGNIDANYRYCNQSGCHDSSRRIY